MVYELLSYLNNYLTSLPKKAALVAVKKDGFALQHVPKASRNVHVIFAALDEIKRFIGTLSENDIFLKITLGPQSFKQEVQAYSARHACSLNNAYLYVFEHYLLEGDVIPAELRLKIEHRMTSRFYPRMRPALLELMSQEKGAPRDYIDRATYGTLQESRRTTAPQIPKTVAYHLARFFTVADGASLALTNTRAAGINKKNQDGEDEKMTISCQIL